MTYPNTPEQFEGLRVMRAYHWLMVMKYRPIQVKQAASLSLFNRRNAEQIENAIGMHLRFVQYLNGFFPETGDTAERDVMARGWELNAQGKIYGA